VLQKKIAVQMIAAKVCGTVCIDCPLALSRLLICDPQQCHRCR
jgi:hypothetical protein